MQLAADPCRRVAEVGLEALTRRVRPMDERLRREELRAQIGDVLAHTALGDRPHVLEQQPPDPLRADPRVGGDPPTDPLAPGIQSPTTRRARALERGRLLRERPPHRLHVQPKPARHFLLRHALDQVHVADLGPLRHSDHLQDLPQRQLGSAFIRHECPREATRSRFLLRPPAPPQGVPFQSAAGSLFSVPSTARE